MNHFLVCALVSALVAFTSATSFNDCGSTSGSVSSVEITNCPDGQDVCTLKRGTDAAITINFSASDDSKSLKAVVHGEIHSVPIPFPLPKSDACKSGVACPVKKGQTYIYKNSLNIRESYPPISVTIKWELKDEKNNDMVCIEIAAQLQ